MPEIKRDHKGISPVLASIILSAIVLAIGAAVWGVTQSATGVMADSYYREVNASINRIKERFTVEHIGFENSTQEVLKVWVYNHGQVDINVDVYIEGGGSSIGSNQSLTLIPAGELVRIDVIVTNVTKDMSVGVEVASFRGNMIYETTQIP